MSLLIYLEDNVLLIPDKPLSVCVYMHSLVLQSFALSVILIMEKEIVAAALVAS